MGWMERFNFGVKIINCRNRRRFLRSIRVMLSTVILIASFARLESNIELIFRLLFNIRCIRLRNRIINKSWLNFRWALYTIVLLSMRTILMWKLIKEILRHTFWNFLFHWIIPICLWCFLKIKYIIILFQF